MQQRQGDGEKRGHVSYRPKLPVKDVAVTVMWTTSTTRFRKFDVVVSQAQLSPAKATLA
jgi:hypothetical protein